MQSPHHELKSLAQAMCEQGEFRSAELLISYFLKSEKEDIEARNIKAKCLIQLGRFEAVVEYLDQTLTLNQEFEAEHTQTIELKRIAQACLGSVWPQHPSGQVESSEQKRRLITETLSNQHNRIENIQSSVDCMLRRTDDIFPASLPLELTFYQFEVEIKVLIEKHKKLFEEAKPIIDVDEFRAFAMDHASTMGLHLEFGVFKGHSINFMSALRPDVTFHGFDSFYGLPEDWGSVPKGTLNLDGKLPDVNSNVILHAGLFEDTVPDFLEEHQGHVSLIHIDCDLYSSTVTVLSQFKDRIVAGTVIIFDEYIDAEYRAFQEFVEAHDVKYKFLCRNIFARPVAVQITDI